MDLAITQQNYAEKCDRVARYFIKHVPQMSDKEKNEKLKRLDKPAQELIFAYNFIKDIPHLKRSLNNTLTAFAQLDAPIKQLIFNLAAEKKSPCLMIICAPSDVLTALIQKTVPQYEQKPKLISRISQFERYDERGRVQPRNDNPTPAQLAQEKTDQKQAELVSTHGEQQAILKLPITDALAIISRYLNQATLKVSDVFEDTSSKQTSAGDNFYWEDIDGPMNREYGFSLNDFIKITPELEKLLTKIAHAHTQAIREYDPKLRYQITPEDKKLLVENKDIINNKNNVLFNSLTIQIAEPTTKLQAITDKILLAVPLAFAEGVLPQLVYNTTGYKFPLILIVGSGMAYGGGYLTGNWVYPCFDWFNSSARKTRKWFGPKNGVWVEKRWSFGLLSVMHYLLIAAADLSLSYQKVPCQIIGYLLHGFRAASFGSALFLNNRNAYNKNQWLKHFFADLFYLKKYDDLVWRRNADDKSYTVGDLVNNPENDIIIKKFNLFG